MAPSSVWIWDLRCCDIRRTLKLATIVSTFFLSYSQTILHWKPCAWRHQGTAQSKMCMFDTFEQVLWSCKRGSVVNVSVISKESGSMAVASRSNERNLLICQTSRKDCQCIPALCHVLWITENMYYSRSLILFMIRCCMAKLRRYSEPFEMATFIGIILNKIVSISQKTLWTFRNGIIYRNNIKENSLYLAENALNLSKWQHLSE
jgi:hypothetical protein